MRTILPVLFIVMIAFSACRKCQFCEYQWEYTENDTTHKGLEFSDEQCGMSWVLDEHKQEMNDEKSSLDVLLKKDPDKKDIVISPVTCTETPY